MFEKQTNFFINAFKNYSLFTLNCGDNYQNKVVNEKSKTILRKWYNFPILISFSRILARAHLDILGAHSLRTTALATCKIKKKKNLNVTNVWYFQPNRLSMVS